MAKVNRKSERYCYPRIPNPTEVRPKSIDHYGRCIVYEINAFSSSHERIGLRYMLHKQGFHILLLNEFKTSTSCPDCFSPTYTFRDRRSRRPWRRHLPPQRVHGLLECRHEHCVAECNGQSKKWNRDLLAVLNFRRIWNAYVSGNDRPQDLCRGRLAMSMNCANVDNYRSDNSDPLCQEHVTLVKLTSSS